MFETLELYIFWMATRFYALCYNATLQIVSQHLLLLCVLEINTYSYIAHLRLILSVVLRTSS